MKRQLTLYTLAIGLLALGNSASAQQSSRKTDRQQRISGLVETGRYVFKARSAQSMSGHVRQLTSAYDLAITPDTLTAYLPYFGRAYSAPMDPSKGGIQFTSTHFEYQVDSLKKGGWSVAIRPKDVPEVQRLFLTISPDGYGSLNVTSSQRQPISFNGVIAQER